MKSYLEVEKNRISSHQNFNINKNTVHRSSLIVPKLKGAYTSISFLNHFLLKRNYKDVVIKIIAVDINGNYVDDLTTNIDEPKVYFLPLDKMFGNLKINNYLIEFFTSKNLYIPYPAVMINHIGKNFCSVVHAFNRVLNDVFEDDKINSLAAPEAAIDVYSDKKYETFINFASGQQSIKDKLKFEYQRENKKIQKLVKINLPRFSHKSFVLSKVFNKNLNGGVLKISQPKQKMFYGRLFGGVKNIKTNNFSANHSYYCSNDLKEYFNTQTCYRTYPYFENFTNNIIVYPIMSPSKISFKIKILSNGKEFISDEKILNSPSGKEIKFDIDKIIFKEKLSKVTAFTLIGNTKNNKIPSRVNLQAIYGSSDKKNKIKGSVNTSMLNNKMFVSKNKTKVVWGQIISDADYVSKLGFVFGDPSGEKDSLSIDIYSEKGFVRNINKVLKPNESFQLTSKDIINNKKINSHKNSKLYWYLAKSKRHDLTAFSFHYNKISGDGSGEHGF